MKVKTKCRFSKLCKYPHTEDGECDKFCSFNTREVKTNADRIRLMTDEEMAELLVYQERCPDGAIRKSSKDCYALQRHGSCESCWLEWLRKEADK